MNKNKDKDFYQDRKVEQSLKYIDFEINDELYWYK